MSEVAMTEHHAQLVDSALALFKRHFAGEPDICTSAPGRCNLIGEHTDYSEGFVLPFALEYRTVIVGRVVPAADCR